MSLNWLATLRNTVVGIGIGSLTPAWAAPPQQGAAVEQKVQAILSQMTLSEKLSYINIDDGHMMRPLPKYGLPGTVSYDSSMGIHVESTMFGTQYPALSALASTWNIERARQYGLALGFDTRAAGGQQVLSPGLNLYRTPFNGRGAEHLSGEDPYLGAVMGSVVTNAIQAQGVWTAAKHYLANEQEANRHFLNVHVSERALRELYLPGFESLVKNANPAAIMCGFNKINGDYACESHRLIADALKGEWNFQGFVLSDFNSINDGLKAALAGTDLDMPSGLKMNEATLRPYIDSGVLPLATIDDKVRRNLRAMVSYGFDQGLPAASGIKDDPRSLRASLQVAREGIVLLKNAAVASGAKLLPLNKASNIAVIGNMAEQAPPSPFGTAWSEVPNNVTELTGIRRATSGTVTFLRSLSLNPARAVWYTQDPASSNPQAYVRGLRAEYFNNADLSGAPAVSRIEPGVNWEFLSSTNSTAQGTTTVAGFSTTQGSFSARFVGKIRPTVTGRHVFKVRGDGSLKLWVNNRQIVDFDGTPLSTDLADPIAQSGRTVVLQAGQLYDVQLEYSRVSSFYIPAQGGLWGVQMSWAALAAPENLAQYDAVVIVAGINNEYEGEASDHGFGLPEYQDEMISNVIAANPRTVVVLHAGGTLDVSAWVNNVKGLLHAWYPGAFAGTALAQIIFGDNSPSGKLPVTWDRDIVNNPSYPSYPDPRPYQGANALADMTYSEDIFMGYRGYDKAQKRPLFAFGHGLSYTTFQYSDLKTTPAVMVPGNDTTVTFTLTNTGNMAGYETAQLYIQPLAPVVARPLKELKGFAKVLLQPGESRQLSMTVNGRAFAYFDPATFNWIVDAGRYRVLVGGASDDLPLRASLTALYREELPTNTSNPLASATRAAVQVAPAAAY
ncbi:glycoside hydrolase family 3 C-terminal domain-containing protein [Pseudomonas sp. NPDC087358]|uniref:beta-glucosidase n=1 Tax=Pseudomonas sp. NPDC087358 TaxID=3364439 RepID=UPI00385062F9